MLPVQSSQKFCSILWFIFNNNNFLLKSFVSVYESERPKHYIPRFDLFFNKNLNTIFLFRLFYDGK